MLHVRTFLLRKFLHSPVSGVYYFHFTGWETAAQSAKLEMIFIGVYHVPETILGMYMCQCL